MVFIEETEIDERGIRRLAQSRGTSVTRNGSVWNILGAGIDSIDLTDDECWDVLGAMPQQYTLSGRNIPVR